MHNQNIFFFAGMDVFLIPLAKVLYILEEPLRTNKSWNSAWSFFFGLGLFLLLYCTGKAGVPLLTHVPSHYHSVHGMPEQRKEAAR